LVVLLVMHVRQLGGTAILPQSKTLTSLTQPSIHPSLPPSLPPQMMANPPHKIIDEVFKERGKLRDTYTHSPLPPSPPSLPPSPPR